VCNRRFKDADAQAACRTLGFRSGSYDHNMGLNQYFGSGSGQIWLDYVYCTGSEVSLSECGHRGWGVHNCYHWQDVSVVCNNCSSTHPQCETIWNSNVWQLHKQLVRGTWETPQVQSFCSGWHNCSTKLESIGCTYHDLSIKVLQYSSWSQFRIYGTIKQLQYKKATDSIQHFCRNIEPHEDIYRSCFESGLYSSLQEVCNYGHRLFTRCIWLESRIYCFARIIQDRCRTSSADVHMLKMILYGEVLNANLNQCVLDFDQLIGDNRHLRDIVCSMSNVTARLAGNNISVSNAGRLEIYYNNTWGTVCATRFNGKAAQVACYMMGCGRSGQLTYQRYGRVSGPIWLSEVECTGHELSLAECGHSGWGLHNCHHYQDVSIICNNNCSINPREYEMLCNKGLITTAEETTVTSQMTTSTIRTITTRAPGNPVTFQVISVDSVWPLYGPVAGGTRVTITGQFPIVNAVIAVYFGKNQGFIESIQENVVLAATPSVNETARHLDVELILNDGSVINTNHKFEYRGNPVFTDTKPRDHLTRGGTQVTVSGDNLDSVAEPRITLTAVVTRFYNETESVSTKTEADSEPCKLPEAKANGSQILCQLPAVSLPDELTEDLAVNDSAKAETTEGPGVSAYVSSDGRTRADIYVGLKLDGFKRFQNISSVDSSIKIQFSLPPTIFCEPIVEFDPNEHIVISTKGQHMQRGTQLVDYDIRLGVAVCVPVSLSDNHVDCRPPANKPDRNINDTFCHGETLSLQLMIGYAHYQCSCVRYLLQDNTALIVGLSVGIILLLIVIATIIIIFLLYRRHQKRKTASQDKGKATEEDEEYRYCNKLPGDYQQSMELDDLNSIKNTENDAGYSKELPGDNEESAKRNDLDNSGAENGEIQYSRQLPSFAESSNADDVDNGNTHYCKQLPDDVELDDHDEIVVTEEDAQYSRVLPDDYQQSVDSDSLNDEYSVRLPEYYEKSESHA